MEKKGLVLKIFGIVFLCILLLAAIGGFYLYKIHVFKTIRLCVSNVGENSEIPCETKQDCLDVAERFGLTASVDDAPDFIKENFNAIVDESIYCEGTCFVKEIRGIDFESQDFEELDSCMEKEKEFVIEIRGKEGLEILKYMRENDIA